MRLELPERRIVGPAGELIIPHDDEITPRLIMLIEGECEGLGRRRGRPQARHDQTTILSVAHAIQERGRSGPPEPETRAQDQLRPHRRGRTPSHSPPLPRSRCLGRRHRSEAPPGRLRDQHPQCRADHRKVWPSKKNSIATARDPEPPIEAQATQNTHQTRPMRSAQYRVWGATIPRRQGHGEPGRHLAAGPRIAAPGGLGPGVRLDRATPRTRRAAAGFATDPRGGPVPHRLAASAAA